MANPQPDEPHGIIAHEIQENIIIRDFTKQHLKIIYLLIRLSWGCGVKGWQYQSYKDFEVIGLFKSDVAKALKYLHENKIIVWNEKYKLLIFQKDFDRWTVPTKTNTDVIKGLIHKSLKNANEVSKLLTVLEKDEQKPLVNHEQRSEKTLTPLVNHEQIEAGKPVRETVCILPKERLNKDIYNIDHFFESIWVLYPHKRGKASISDTQKAKLFKVGFDEMSRCIERYKKDKPDWQAWKNGSTFFNKGYSDYLDSVYQEQEKGGGNNDGYQDYTGRF
jgi:hypothetical protein